MPTRDELADALVKAVDERGILPMSPDVPRDTGYSREDYAEEFALDAKAIREIDPQRQQMIP
jgi:hypothetical protein